MRGTKRLLGRGNSMSEGAGGGAVGTCGERTQGVQGGQGAREQRALLCGWRLGLPGAGVESLAKEFGLCLYLMRSRFRV